MGIEKMSFLYLSMSAAHASSLPRRHSLTSCGSVHTGRLFTITEDVRGTSRLHPCDLVDIKLIHIRQHVRFEDRRMKVPDAIFCAHQNMGACQADHWELSRDNLLHLIVKLLAARVIQCDLLLVHKLV